MSKRIDSPQSSLESIINQLIADGSFNLGSFLGSTSSSYQAEKSHIYVNLEI